MRTADNIAGKYLGGDAARYDLKQHILEYGEAMALAAVAAEREACAAIADDHRCDTVPECCNCQGDIAREIRARSKQE